MSSKLTAMNGARLLLIAGLMVGGSGALQTAEREAPGALELLAEVDGKTTADITVRDDELVPLFDGKPVRGAAEITWKLEGDVLAVPELVRFSPIYFVRRSAAKTNPPNRSDTIDVDLHWYLSEDSWPFSEFGNGGTMVFAWMVDGRPIKVTADFVPGIKNTVIRPLNHLSFETSKVTLTIPPEYASGFPAILLRERGRWIKQGPYSDHPAYQHAMVQIYRGDETAFDAALAALRNVDFMTGGVDATLLHLAAESGQEFAVERLLQRGAHADTMSTWSKTGFQSSVRSSHKETPLDWAVRTGRHSIVSRLLREKSAWPNNKTEFERVFRSALDGGWTQIAWTLLNSPPDSVRESRHLAEVVETAARLGDVDVLRQVAATSGPDVFAQVRPETLVRAASDADAPCILVLVQGGADPNVPADGVTPLQAAAERNRIEAVHVLLGAGADVNRRGPDGTTALFAAVRSGRAEAAQVVLDAGADPNLPGPGDATPLHEAVANDRAALATLLLARGARLDAPDQQGRRPLDLSLQNRNKPMATLLIQNGARLAMGAADFPMRLQEGLAQNQISLIQRAVEDGWSPDAHLHGEWPAWQVAEFYGANETATWLRANSAAASGPAVFVHGDLAQPPEAGAVQLGPEARFCHPPHLQAGVDITGVIGSDGTLRFAQIVRTPSAQLAQFVTDALARWKFVPGMKGNQPVHVRTMITVTFAPDKNRKRGPHAETVTFRDPGS